MLQLSSPLSLSSNNLSYLIHPHDSSLLAFSVCLINLPWSCFSFHWLRLSSFFCFLAVDTGPSYCDKILSLLENLNNLSSDWSRYRERFLQKDVLQFLHSLQCSEVLVHLPFLECTVCQCHSVCGTFYSSSLSFVSSYLKLSVHRLSILVFQHYILLRITPGVYCPNCIYTI